MDLGLSDKVAMVAGGSSGLGFAIASELAREGAHVAIAARDGTRLAEAEARLKAIARGTVVASRVDLTDAVAVRAWVDEVAGRFGRIEIVVTNSSGPPFGYASGFDLDDYRDAFDRVMVPAVALSLATLPHLKAAGWGRLLLIASETVSTPVPRLALSGVARAGLVRFAQSLAAEAGAWGVTVNVLAPGVTRTPALERAAARLAEGDVAVGLGRMGLSTALGRVARAEEVAAVAAFLASARASFVTGTVQLVDGGAQVIGQDHGYLAGADRATYP